MPDLGLKTFNKLYPMMIRKYQDLIVDQNASEADKINSIILKLNALGKLSNDVVRDWNTVYNWVMNDGLNQDVSNKIELMKSNGELDTILQGIFNTLTGDMTTLHTTAKDTIVNSINEVDDLAKSNQSQLAQIATNAKSQGAKGDGVSDDTTAIQNALNNNNGVVLIPPGSYMVSSLTIASAVTLMIPRGVTITQIANTSNDLIVITSDNVKIIGEGILDGNKTNQTRTNNVITIKGNKCIVKGLEIKNAKLYGIYGNASSYNRILNNYVHNTANIAIFFQCNSTTLIGCNYNLIQGNTIIGTDGEGGIKVHGDVTNSVYCYGNKIIGNHIENVAQISIEVWGLSYRSVIQGNTCIGGMMGVSLATSDYSTVTGNTIYNSTTDGIELAKSNHCSVSGNAIDGNNATGQGIILDTTSMFNSITGNMIYHIVNYGIQLQSGCNNNVLSGNLIDTYGTYGINLQSCAYLTLVANHIINGGLKGIIVDSSNNILIDGCLVDTATQHGILLYTGSATPDNITITNSRLTRCNTNIGTQGTTATNLKIKNNVPFNYDTEKAGVVSLPASATTVNVSWGFFVAPTNVTATAQGNVGNMWVTNITATGCTINVATAPAGTTNISWRAEQ